MKKHQNNHLEELKTFRFFIILILLGFIVCSFSSCEFHIHNLHKEYTKDSTIIYTIDSISVRNY